MPLTCGMMLRQTYDEVGLPCRKRIVSPRPSSMYAIRDPRTLANFFWYMSADLPVALPLGLAVDPRCKVPGSHIAGLDGGVEIHGVAALLARAIARGLAPAKGYVILRTGGSQVDGNDPGPGV